VAAACIPPPTFVSTFYISQTLVLSKAVYLRAHLVRYWFKMRGRLIIRDCCLFFFLFPTVFLPPFYISQIFVSSNADDLRACVELYWCKMRGVFSFVTAAYFLFPLFFLFSPFDFPQILGLSNADYLRARVVHF